MGHWSGCGPNQQSVVNRCLRVSDVYIAGPYELEAVLVNRVRSPGEICAVRNVAPIIERLRDSATDVAQAPADEPSAMLANIFTTWFTEGFDTADLKEAKALIEELSL